MDERLDDGVVCGIHVSVQREVALSTAVERTVAVWSYDPVLDKQINLLFQSTSLSLHQITIFLPAISLLFVLPYQSGIRLESMGLAIEWHLSSSYIWGLPQFPEERRVRQELKSKAVTFGMKSGLSLPQNNSPMLYY